MTEYKIYRYELWGNEKDGFDCNNQFLLGMVDIKANSSDRQILREYIRPSFDGYSYAFTENKSGHLRAKNAQQWGLNWSDEFFADITYRGTAVGSIEAIQLVRVSKFEHIAGEWDDEEDLQKFESSGYQCIVLRGPVGSLNGYVELPLGHPSFGKHYDDVDVEVHGGLTYGSHTNPDTGEKDLGFWLGFDTAHAGDITPKTSSLLRAFSEAFEPRPGGTKDTYKNFAYVREQVVSLAKQLKAIEVANVESVK